MIPRKLKTCKTCQTNQYIWSHGNCKDCDAKSRHVGHDLPKDSLRVNSGKKTKPWVAIASIGMKRQEALKEYRKRRDAYFKEYPVCEFPDCTSTDITLHHMRGRIGILLIDIQYFKSLCGKHHRFVEENPETAQKLGLSMKRLNK